MEEMTLPEPETDKLQEFHAEWDSILAQKAADEEAAEKEMFDKAKQTREQFNEAREELMDRNTTRNREAERVLFEQIDNDIEGSGNAWERVVKLVDLQADHGDDKLDTSRMRQVFLKMKNSPKA